MGRYVDTFINTSLTLKEARTRSKAVRQWLTEHEVILPDCDNSDSESIHRYKLGNHVSRIIEDLDYLDAYGESLTLDIGVGWQYAHPTMGEIFLYCRQCGFENNLDKAWKTIQAWHDHKKPNRISCDLCGYVAPLMEWNSSPPFAIGHLAVIAENWPRLKKDFVRDLLRALGPKSMWLSCKY